MNIKYVFILLLSLLITQLTFGRNCGISSDDNEDTTGVIEKVYLHVDRDIYFSGDDIWYKAYLIDALDHTLTGHSGNLHVELISPDSKIVLSNVTRLIGGLGNGAISIPQNLNSGRYLIRAYTNYMRNYGDQLFFTREIRIINGAGDQNTESTSLRHVDRKYRLYFFPEGGSLIDNVSSLIAFKTVDWNGKGFDVSGKVFSSNGELITAFKSSHLGMGLFQFKPTSGLTYYCIYKAPDSTEIRAELPRSFSKGITFSVIKNSGSDLLLDIKTNAQSLPLLSDQDLVLNVSIRDEVIDTLIIPIRSTENRVEVPTFYLPDGIIELTLSAIDDLPLSERLVYIENGIPTSINIETDKTIYNKRDQVKLSLSVAGDSTSENSFVSLSAVNDNFLNNQSLFPRSISSWFLLESDVHGTVEEPSYYFDPTENDRLKNLDLLLLTQGWRDFAWKYSQHYFPPEDGFSVSGKLRGNNRNKPISDARVSIGIFGNGNPLFLTIPVDSSGKFRLSGIDLLGKGTIIISGIDKNDKLNGVVAIDSNVYIPPKVAYSFNNVFIPDKEKQADLNSYYLISEALIAKYKISDTVMLGGVNIISKRNDAQIERIERDRTLYLKPDNELIVTEQMESYRNLPELIRGKIPGVDVFGPKYGQYVIFIRGVTSQNGETQPLILIDGFPATMRDLERMPVTLVDRIDVLKMVSSTVIYGIQGANGVINIITKAGGGEAKFNSNESSVNHRISGYSMPRIFYSPKHLSDSLSAYKPDFRKTLFWKPNIELEGNSKKEISYYNGDNTSVVRIIVEGITESGNPITGTAEYEVK